MQIESIWCLVTSTFFFPSPSSQNFKYDPLKGNPLSPQTEIHQGQKKE